MPSLNTPPNTVLHLGAMDWTPNVQGVQWLKDEVWPLVHQASPELRLLLAGRQMPEDWASDESLGIDILGEVEDAQATYNSPCIVVVPLHAGSGMRIKLAEALASGRPVVTTTKGMEGMDLTPGKHVWVADDAPAMGKALVHLIQSPDTAIELGKAGRQWALDHLDHRARARILTDYLQSWVDA